MFFQGVNLFQTNSAVPFVTSFALKGKKYSTALVVPVALRDMKSLGTV